MTRKGKESVLELVWLLDTKYGDIAPINPSLLKFAERPDWVTDADVEEWKRERAERAKSS